MPDLLTIANLNAGIDYWREKKRNWPPDFHNALYQELAGWRAGGLTPEWWSRTVPLLSGWKALRPYPTQAIHARGLTVLPGLHAAHHRLAQGNRSLDFSGIRWDQLSELFEIACSIKPVSSPVFGSKLSHFIMPAMFPVIDRDAVGLHPGGYKSYWNELRTSWTGCAERPILISRLTEAIGAQPAIDYPWGPKITELCRIGKRAHESAEPSP